MAATYDWGTIKVERRRTVDYTFTLYQIDAATGITLAATDVVRFKVFTKDGDIALDIDSVAATTVGKSVVTIDSRDAPAQVTVRFGQDDVTTLTAKQYLGEICVVDDSETAPVDAIKRVAHGRIAVLASGSGDVGKT